MVGEPKDFRTVKILLCQTHAIIEELHSRLAILDIPFRSTHGGYSQEEREVVIYKFKKGKIPTLVSTTGIGGRGLNLKSVDCIILWDMPVSLDQYKWCLGRIGR